MSYTLLEQVKIRLKQFHMETKTSDEGIESTDIVFDSTDENPLIEQLIADAKADFKLYRCYPAYFTDERIEEDIENHNNIIVRLVVYDYNKIGADFESQDSENGTIRTYEKREAILGNISPFVTVL